MLNLELRDYQKQAIEKALQVGSCGYYLSPGLGKTLTSLATTEKLNPDVLIITAPKLLLDEWTNEINTKTDWDYNLIVWDSNRSKTKTFQREVSQALQSDKLMILLTNVEAYSNNNKTLERLMHAVFAKGTSYWVMDEITRIKSHDAARTKALTKLAPLATWRTGLTGTDTASSILNLYTMINWQNSNFWLQYGYRNFWQFRAKYAILKEIPVNNSRGKAKIVVGYRKVDELMRIIDPVIYRARKEDVAKNLPDKVIKDVQVPMNKQQQAIYKQLVDEYYAEYKDQEINITHAVTLFTRLRQIISGFMPETGQPIGDENLRMQYIAEDTEDNDNKIIIWSKFTSEIKALEKFFGGSSVTFYGQNTKEQNDENKHRFRNDPDVKYFIANPSSASFGLNLEFSEYQYFYSLPESPESYFQALDRSHRLTSKNTVFYKRLYAPGTIEQKLLKSLDGKIDIMRAIHAKDFDFFT